MRAGLPRCRARGGPRARGGLTCRTTDGNVVDGDEQVVKHCVTVTSGSWASSYENSTPSMPEKYL